MSSSSSDSLTCFIVGWYRFRRLFWCDSSVNGLTYVKLLSWGLSGCPLDVLLFFLNRPYLSRKILPIWPWTFLRKYFLATWYSVESDWLAELFFPNSDLFCAAALFSETGWSTKVKSSEFCLPQEERNSLKERSGLRGYGNWKNSSTFWTFMSIVGS